MKTPPGFAEPDALTGASGVRGALRFPVPREPIERSGVSAPPFLLGCRQDVSRDKRCKGQLELDARPKNGAVERVEVPTAAAHHPGAVGNFPASAATDLASGPVEVTAVRPARPRDGEQARRRLQGRAPAEPTRTVAPSRGPTLCGQAAPGC